QQDNSVWGHVFLDAGTGWSTPIDFIPLADQQYVKRNTFDLRAAVGFGVNIVWPSPIRFDWGYKLDRNRAMGEKTNEFTLTMNMPW
ncbi:BamA/TamA family outer membrane protein, partial [bacterium]|nr:BamA/TamA family outer membrane protein [bacterium]